MWRVKRSASIERRAFHAGLCSVARNSDKRLKIASQRDAIDTNWSTFQATSIEKAEIRRAGCSPRDRRPYDRRTSQPARPSTASRARCMAIVRKRVERHVNLVIQLEVLATAGRCSTNSIRAGSIGHFAKSIPHRPTMLAPWR